MGHSGMLDQRNEKCVLGASKLDWSPLGKDSFLNLDMLWQVSQVLQAHKSSPKHDSLGTSIMSELCKPKSSRRT